MKKYLPLAATILALGAIAFTLRLPRNPDAYDVIAFGHLPALVNGRVKPLDTVARTSLLMIQGRQRVSTPDGGTLIPGEWLLDVFYRPERADTYQTFEIVHPDLLSVLNLTPSDGAGGKRFSMRQISPRIGELDRQAKLADSTESAVRTPFQRATVQLRNAVLLYQRLQGSVLAPGSGDFLAQLKQLERALPGMSQTQPAPGAHSSDAAKLILEMGTSFATMERFAYLHPIPPDPRNETGAWRSVGAVWTATLANGRVDPGARVFASLGRAWRERQPELFNRVARAQRDQLTRDFPNLMRKSSVETRFNSSQPFYSSAVLYVLGFLAAAVSWLKWPELLG